MGLANTLVFTNMLQKVFRLLKRDRERIRGSSPKEIKNWRNTHRALLGKKTRETSRCTVACTSVPHTKPPLLYMKAVGFRLAPAPVIP